MKRLLFKTAGATGFARLASFINRKEPLVLAFHGVTSTPPAGSFFNHQGKHLYQPTFRRFMTRLKKCYQPVSLDRILDWIEHLGEVPERAVAVTFDDGYRNVYTQALPVLLELEIPATVFVVTDFAFGGRPLWTDRLVSALGLTRVQELRFELSGRSFTMPLDSWQAKCRADDTLRAMLKSLPDGTRTEKLQAILESLDLPVVDPVSAWEDHRALSPGELRELSLNDVQVGSHGCSHAILSRLGADQIEEEVTASRALIEDAIGRPCRAFSYPNGAPGDFDRETRAKVVAAGYRCAVTTVKARIGREQDPYEIPRSILADNRTSPAEFDVGVSGLRDLLRPGHRGKE